MKICKTCGELKPYTEFHKKKRGIGGRNAHCKPCRSIANIEYRTPDDNRKTYIKYAYGLTLSEYDDLLESQNHSCSVCHRHESLFGKRLSIDHDHKCCPGKRSCGKCIRGLLCTYCNTALGFVNEDIQTLKSMIEYLEEK